MENIDNVVNVTVLFTLQNKEIYSSSLQVFCFFFSNDNLSKNITFKCKFILLNYSHSSCNFLMEVLKSIFGESFRLRLFVRLLRKIFAEKAQKSLWKAETFVLRSSYGFIMCQDTASAKNPWGCDPLGAVGTLW